MSLKSRLQTKRRSKSKLLASTDVDLIEFLEKNKDISKLVIYSHNRIFTEKKGEEAPSDITFSSETAYSKEIFRIAELYENIPSFENPYVQIYLSDEINMEIFIPPFIREGIYTVLTRNNHEEDNYFENFISSAIYTYLQESLKQKLNIFVIGAADINKANAMNFLLNLCDNKNKLIISDKRNELENNKPYCLKINEFNSNISNFVFDNIFANEVSTQELTSIFELIISGYKGFIVSLSLKDKTDILDAIRNKILLSNPNLFEENADFMAGSSIDVILTLGRNNDKNIIITKVSEIYNNAKEYTVKDIFTVNGNGQYMSVGNRSRFFNKTNSPEQFSEKYLKKEYLHSKNIIEQSVPPVFEKETSIVEEKQETTKNDEELKDTKQTEQTENITAKEEFQFPLSNLQNISTDTEKDFKKEKIKENTEEIKKEEKPLSKLEKLKNKIKRNKKLKKINFELSEETTDFEQIEAENTVIRTKQKNIEDKEPKDIIFEQENRNYETSSSEKDILTPNSNIFNTEQSSTIFPSVNILENNDNNSDGERTVDIPEKYNEFYDEDEIVEEPELFSEIKDVEINDDDFDIQDENI